MRYVYVTESHGALCACVRVFGKNGIVFTTQTESTALVERYNKESIYFGLLMPVCRSVSLRCTLQMPALWASVHVLEIAGRVPQMVINHVV